MVGGGVATNLTCSLRDLLASDVVGDDRQRCTATGPCEVRRRPEVSFTQELRDVAGELFSQDACRHTLQAVHEDRDLHGGWILDKQMYVVFLAVELGESCTRVLAGFRHDLATTSQDWLRQRTTSVLGHKDQVDMKIRYLGPASADIRVRYPTW